MSVMRFSWLMMVDTGCPFAVTGISSFAESSFLAAVRMVALFASLTVILGETEKAGKLKVSGYWYIAITPDEIENDYAQKRGSEKRLI
jgi:hypothetical protein